MNKFYSRVKPECLLHIINRFDEIQGRTDICPEEQFIQLATLKMKKGKTFRPHRHIFKNGEDKVIAQESWVVITGSVKFYMYDLDDSLISTSILNPGDCSVTFRGGHTYEILEEGTVVYEYKTGPYKGHEMDKVFI
tara:strand:- start:969 stop:1376 length:408 start_codon:yes stop_codon:yes gene_type:complete